MVLLSQTQKTFTGPEGLFARYSDFLVNCMSRPRGSCQSLGPVYSVPGSDGITIACFAYPREKFRDNHQFVAACVFVAKIKSAENQETCLKGSQNWFVISSEPKTTRSITSRPGSSKWETTGQAVGRAGLYIERSTTECVKSWESRSDIAGCE